MAKRATPQPNILLITTDQQRHDTCGPCAPAFMRTPHVDHLCHEGIRFDAAYSDCPICVPARTSIMSGLFARSHGMMGNGDTSTVLTRRATLPALLHAAGYHSCAIGKLHFTPERARHGFDEVILPADYYREMSRSGNPLQPMRHGLGQNELYPGMATVPESQTLTSWIAEQSVTYIRDRRDPTTPFFLWCSFSKPHPPLDPPEPYYSMYRQADIPAPVFGDWSDDDQCAAVFRRFRQSWSLDQLTPEIIREARAAYYGLITQIDYNMGRIFAALQDLDLFNETLVLYTSDHGEYLGDHHTGGKGYFHEPSAHVPFVLRLPRSWSNRQHGTVCHTPVTMADILPTLVTAGGGRVPRDVDGTDVVALARRSRQPLRYIEGARDDQFTALTDGNWKYIYYPEGATEELFDLANDPQELCNLAGRRDAAPHEKRLRDELI
ncbi:MAG: sulfatase-like hydrolase/transferase, partial [Verrucomicrobia bacterium]|nr:sulfatase-like hydrolase/transferase [Verrucomicrobiota bacterium]